MTIKGKVAIVTGAGRGMGKAISEMLAKEGANVALISRTESEILNLKEKIKNNFKIKALHIPCDISDENKVSIMINEVCDKLGTPDILVNNAGVPTKKPTEVVDYSTEEWNRIIDINLKGAFFCSRGVLPYMRKVREGIILNISSIAGVKAAPNVLPYSVSKSGMMSLNETLIAENLNYGINIHAIVPGVTDTAIWSKKEKPLDSDAQDVMIKPEQIANIAKFFITLPSNVRIDKIVVLPNKFPVQLWDYKLLDQ